MEKNLAKGGSSQPANGTGSSATMALPSNQGLIDQEIKSIELQTSTVVLQKDGREAVFIQCLKAKIDELGRETYDAAWQKIYQEYFPYVCKCCRNVLERWAPKETLFERSCECAQKTFMRAFCIIDKFDGCTLVQLKAWIGAIARNICKEDYRAYQRDPSISTPTEIASNGEDKADEEELTISKLGEIGLVGEEYANDPLEGFIKSERWQEIKQVIMEILSSREQKMFWLHYVKNMKYKEIIEEMDLTMSSSAVKTEMFRIRKRIRQALHDRDLDENWTTET